MLLQGAQTPQIFARDILARAHAAAIEEGTDATDDATVADGPLDDGYSREGPIPLR